MREAKALARMCICAVSPDPPLLACATITKSSCAALFICFIQYSFSVLTGPKTLELVFESKVFIAHAYIVTPVLSGPLKLVFKTYYRLMQFKSIAECSREHSAILSTFIKLPFVLVYF